MGFIGALIGLIIGLAFEPWLGGDTPFIGLIVGGLLGFALSRARGWRAWRDLPTRLDALEAEVARLRRELQAARRAVAAEAPRVEAPPEAPAEPQPVNAESAVVSPDAPAAQPLPAAPPSPMPRRAGLPGFTPPTLAAPAWLQRLFAGNPLAKIGIVVLFFGVASALRLAVDHGLLPVPLRLFATAAAGVALILFGLAKARTPERRNFALAAQGGGFALLYLVGYFMLARYAMIGETSGFALFAALGLACVFLAARQDGPALAVLGLSGAFLAPVLAGGRAETPLPLFVYFTLLNAFILAVDWFRAWRVLNVAGFFFTLAVGMVWALDAYEPRHYAVTQSFLVLFLVVYSAMPVLTALLRAPGGAGWRDGVLLFGTPLAGAFLQAHLMADTPYGLAWSALLGALWYFALWALLYRRPGAEFRLIERSHLGIALALLTVAVPLAFDARVTSAFWAAEGAAVLWFGARQDRRLALYTGLAMQVLAGGALLWRWDDLTQRLPVLNDAVLGALLLAGAGLFSARVLRGLTDAARDNAAAPPSPRLSPGPATWRATWPAPAPLPAVLWALAWWLGVGWQQIVHYAPREAHVAFGLLFVAASALALEGLSRGWRWPQLRAAVAVLLPALWLAALVAIEVSGHPYAGMMALVLPLALALHYLLLAAHERAGEAPWRMARHLGAGWLVLFSLAVEGIWWARRLAEVPLLWAYVALAASAIAGVLLPLLGARRGLWPFKVAQARYADIGVLPPLAALLLVLPLANFVLSGADGLGWPYLPLLNVFDVTQLAGLAALWFAAATLGRASGWAGLARGVIGGLAFLWLTMLAGRTAHHWGGVPFNYASMLDSTLYQALLTLLWSIVAIATMILASRRAHRQGWYAGISLLGVVGAKLLLLDAAGQGTLMWSATLIGVALLLLTAAYFAPMPPKRA